jgi:hypothetical protein
VLGSSPFSTRQKQGRRTVSFPSFLLALDFVLTNRVDELSRRTVEGHHLSLALKNPSGEVIAGAITKAMYEASHTSPHTPHTLRAPVTSSLLMSPLPVTSPAYSFYGNHQSAGRTMNGTTLPHMKGEDYEVGPDASKYFFPQCTPFKKTAKVTLSCQGKLT